ncbi:MAG: hypothetical protein P1P76_08715 [Anaerolineales bacterium]|nr:hypothetical protein [Anaerolineales bacterium]
MHDNYPRYSLPARPLASMLVSFLARRRRSFRTDALALLNGIYPGVRLLGPVPQPPAEGMIVLVNHYSRRGFQAWWIALAVSAVFDAELHWVVTSAWVYDDPIRSSTITPVSRWLLRRIAHAYNFTSMPAMPPKPEDAQLRAGAVLSLVRFAKSAPQPIIGFAPEGFDSASGQLQRPPEGVGRLLVHLARQGLKWSPVGVYEDEGALNLNFGPIIEPVIPDPAQPTLDREVADQAMDAIADCLPDRLHGPYA